MHCNNEQMAKTISPGHAFTDLAIRWVFNSLVLHWQIVWIDIVNKLAYKPKSKFEALQYNIGLFYFLVAAICSVGVWNKIFIYVALTLMWHVGIEMFWLMTSAGSLCKTIWKTKGREALQEEASSGKRFHKEKERGSNCKRLERYLSRCFHLCATFVQHK